MSMFPVDSECQCNPSRLARIHLALADPIRLRILALILVKELSPEQLSQVLGLGPNIIAKHLTYLRDAGVVSRRSHGHNNPYYSACKMATRAESLLVHLTLDLLRLEPYMDGEFATLKAVREREAGCQDSEDKQICQSAQNDFENVVDDQSSCNSIPMISTVQNS